MIDIEVTVAESNALMLTALSEMIEDDFRFSLMSSVANADACLQTLLSVPSQVLLINWHLPAFGAEKLIKILREQKCPTRVIVCTANDSLEIAKRAMGAGAAGYFCHQSPAEQLMDIVETVAKGNMVFPYVDIRELQDPLQSLTPTERSLLSTLAQGQTNKEIATTHQIAVNTVKFHLRNLYDKLNVKNRSQATALYYSLSLPDDITLPKLPE